tara:strand:- start:3970 stop:4404 length:435 start_codon:yes stop_codon:yes gene_type:complete
MKSTNVAIDRNTRESVEFLVPFTSTLVNLLSTPNLTLWNFKKELKKIKINNFSEKDIHFESSSIVNNFKVYILYGGTRNFMLKIEGLSNYIGFCIMVTNKGMVVNDDTADNSMNLSKSLKEQFLLNYKSPYLVTDTYKKFLSKD